MKRILLFVLLVAGVSIFEKAFAGKFDKEIAAFVEADRTNPPPKQAVLFVGSSSIRMWANLAEDFPDLKTINRGFGGSQISDVIENIERVVLPYSPAKIVFYAGDNDIAAGKSPEQILKDYQSFVGLVRKQLPNTPVYFLSIKLSRARWHLSDKGKEANRLIQEFSRKGPKLKFIDVATPLLDEKGEPEESLFLEDKLHLNRKGYETWQPIVARALQEG